MKKFLSAVLCGVTPCLAQESNPFILPKTAMSQSSVGVPCHHQWKNIEIVDDVLARDWKKGAVVTSPQLIEEMVAAKKMRVSVLWGILADAEKDFTFESHYELIYPTEYIPTPGMVEPYPTAYEPRNVGVSFMLKNDIKANACFMESNITQFLGYQDYLSKEQKREGSPNGIYMPKFQVARHRQDNAGGATQSNVIDLRTETSSLALVSYDCKPAKAAQIPCKSSKMYQVSGKVLKVRSETLVKVKNPWAYNSNEYQAWMKTGEAELIAQTAGIIESGKRQQLSAYNEKIYPTEYQESSIEYKQTSWKKTSENPAASKVLPVQYQQGLAECWVPRAFEPRRAGFDMDLEITPSSDGSLQLHYGLENTTYHGRISQRSLPYQGAWLPHITMPGFAVTRVVAKATISSLDWHVIAMAPVICSAKTVEPTDHYLYLIQIKPLP